MSRNYRLTARVLTSILVCLSIVHPTMAEEKPAARTAMPRLDFVETAYDLDIQMVWIPGGLYEMGSRQSKDENMARTGVQTWAMHSEYPVHTVELDGFWIGQTEVTVGQFRKFVEATNYRTEAERQGYGYRGFMPDAIRMDNVSWNNPPYEFDENYPVGCVTFEDIQAFITWLDQETGRSWSLPTEAQWEYVARAGTESLWWWGNERRKLLECEWFNENSEGRAHPVALLKPNGFGLYDLLGNMIEPCRDNWTLVSYETMPLNEPVAYSKNSFNEVFWSPTPSYSMMPKVKRGSNFTRESAWGRTAARNNSAVGWVDIAFGVRLVIEPDETNAPDEGRTAHVAGRITWNGEEPGETFRYFAFIPRDAMVPAFTFEPAGDGTYSVDVPPGEYRLEGRLANRSLRVFEDVWQISEGENTQDIALQTGEVTAVMKLGPDDEFASGYIDVYMKLDGDEDCFLFEQQLNMSDRVVIEGGLPTGEYRAEFYPLMGSFRGKSDWTTVVAGETTQLELIDLSIKEPVEKQIYTLSIKLEPGTYEYKFYDDAANMWFLDPGNPDHSGEYDNCLFKVPATGEGDVWPRVNNDTGEVTFQVETETRGTIFVRGSFNDWAMTLSSAMKLVEEETSTVE